MNKMSEWRQMGFTNQAEYILQREATRKKVASHSKENRIRKAAIILGKNDGTTINSRVAYLIDFCGMDSTEILQALDNAVQNDSMWV